MARPAILQRKPAARSAPVQAKLNVGPVGDRFEQEADRVASRIGSPSATSASPPPTISGLSVQRAPAPVAPGPEKHDDDITAPEKRAQRKATTAPKKTDDKKSTSRAQRKAGAAAPKKDEKKPASRAQRKAATTSKAPDDRKPPKKAVAQRDSVSDAVVGAQGGAVPAHVDASIQRMRQRPAPGLDPTTRARVENAVGSDLSGVRVHTDTAAADAANALGARAFTVGQDMFFGQGQYGTQTTEGQRLIAHEAAHTVQQGGGSAGAQRVQRVKKQKPPDPNAPPITSKVKKLEGTDWSIDATPPKIAPTGGTLMVPKLELPLVMDALKGSANSKTGLAAEVGTLPVVDQPFTRAPQAERAEREEGPAFEKWVKHMRTTASEKLKGKLETQMKAQGDAATISNIADKDVYVLKRASLSADSLDLLLVGTPEELSQHDSLVRPMLSRAGGKSKGGAVAELQADHILEDQLGGPDIATNMWLLDAAYNQSIGSQIKTKINTSIKDTLEKAEAEQDKQAQAGVGFDGEIPDDIQAVKRKWAIVFKTVTAGKFSGAPKNWWTRAEIEGGEHLKFYSALTEEELAKQGFNFNKNIKPTRINVFPARDGGKPYPFKVASDGKSLNRPGHFFSGITVTGDPVYKPLTTDTIGQIIMELPIAYQKRKEKGKKDMIGAEGTAKIKHDPRLGFGGYVTRESITGMFADSDFKDLSPMSFPDVGISPEGELRASGEIAATKALFPGLRIPIYLQGTDIFISFPIPTDKLSFGPVSVTEAALDLGVGDKGFFIQGTATILVQDVGQGTLSARVEKDDVIIAGDFLFDLDFLNPAKIAVVYSLAKDDFNAKATLGVQKGALPGVDSGQVEVEVTRQTFGLVGTLNLGGILSGSVITIGYTPSAGLLIEGKDLPLPVEKLPGVSDAKVTVRAQRNPDTGAWSVSGGGKANLAAGGAKGTLDIMFDGIAVTFTGRVDVAKGPATGWLLITGTNRAIDDEGKPIEGGPVGDLHIWGKGEATIAFGKILTGKAGIEYTPDGRVIITGEIALPPTYDLFPKKDLAPKEPLFSVSPPDFPIWGVKVGPVGFGIFAFVDASIKLDAYVGPGQLRDTKVNATIDLDKPEEATVHGQAQFYVPAYAGLTLDVGGGVKAQAAVAYVKGRVGLYGTLGLLIEGSFDVGVDWNPSDGFAVGAEAKVVASPKFELGVNASITAGVDVGLFDIDKTWGPWKKKLGEFGPNMQLGATFPMKWSEKDGLDFDVDDIQIQKPSIDAKEIMKGAFDMLV